MSEAHKLSEGLKAVPKTIPCSFLYDSRGSMLYDKIVELPEYYPYRTELGMLQEHAFDIIDQIPSGSVIVELGCGTATKTAILLQALLKRDGPDSCFFEGIDVSADFLDAAKRNVIQTCHGMKPENTGTICLPYLQGLEAARDRHPEKVLCILWLGSSIGNLEPEEALQFFRDMLRIGGKQTQVFLCADLWKDACTLKSAYHDSAGVTEDFIRNGLHNALCTLGMSQESPDITKWPYHVVVNPELQQVEMWLEAGEDIDDLIPGSRLVEGERILMEVSRKFTQEKLRGLAFQSGFFWQASWTSPLYSMQLLSAPAVAMQACWRDEDAFFAAVADWEALPIETRRPFGFYYAHLAAFSKLKLFPEEDPSDLDIMFSRGIDPDVEQPDKCHSHPEAPPAWPPKHEIISYVQQVRARILEAEEAGALKLRNIYLAMEHSRMHLETLQYMRAQQHKSLFEAGLQHPSDTKGQDLGSCELPEAAFASSVMRSGSGIAHGGLVRILSGEVTVGVDIAPTKHFVWDNEGPAQEPQHVDAFEVGAMPVSVEQYLAFVLHPQGYRNPEWWSESDFQLFNGENRHWPASWTVQADKAWVHLPSGSKAWQEVSQQPVWVCLAEATAFCSFSSCRIMSEPEYQRVLDARNPSVKQLRSGGWELLSTPFEALKGFEPMTEYIEYSTDFFDGKHYVLRGSSPVTHPSVCRDSFRNFYQCNYPYVFSKFRCCMDVRTSN